MLSYVVTLSKKHLLESALDTRCEITIYLLLILVVEVVCSSS